MILQEMTLIINEHAKRKNVFFTPDTGALWPCFDQELNKTT